MKTLIKSFALLFTLTFSAYGHGEALTDQAAIAATESMINKMTFKDMDYGVGKLDKSWKKATSVNVKIHENAGQYIVVAVTNPETAETLYFTVNSHGRVETVKTTP